MPTRLTRAGATVLVVVAGGAMLAFASMALAKSLTLKVTKNAHVDNAQFKSFEVKPVNTHESIAVGPSGFAVYTFQGETTHHLICMKTSNPSTNCWAFWPPVSPASASGLAKQPGISGRLGTFHNHGTLQLTLNGQPLYYFTPDIQSHNKTQALGDEIKTFGSIWHVVKAGGSASTTATTPTAPSTSATPTTPSSPSPYPNGY